MPSHELPGCLIVSSDSSQSVTHREYASHSFKTSRSGTHRSTEKPAAICGAEDSRAGRASAADANRELWSGQRKALPRANGICSNLDRDGRKKRLHHEMETLFLDTLFFFRYSIRPIPTISNSLKVLCRLAHEGHLPAPLTNLL